MPSGLLVDVLIVVCCFSTDFWFATVLDKNDRLHCNPLGYQVFRPDWPPTFLSVHGTWGSRQFIINSLFIFFVCFFLFFPQDPHRPKEKFGWEDFCRRTGATGMSLGWYSIIYKKKKKAWLFLILFLFFLASVLILLNLIYKSTFTIIFLCGKQLKSFIPK